MEQTQPIVNPDVVPEIQIKPTKPWLKIALFAGLGLVLVGSLVFAGYQLGKTKTQPASQLIPTPMAVVSPIPTPTIVITSIPDSTADWKTYTNTKYGYSIRYPSNWDVREFPESSGQLEVTSFNPNKVTNRLSAVFITISLRPYEEEAVGNGEPVKVGNFTAKKIYGGAPPNATSVYLRIVTPIGTKSIIFESSTDHETVLDKMLSTFKFLDQPQTDETANWKTYTSQPGKFSIKYPPNWPYVKGKVYQGDVTASTLEKIHFGTTNPEADNKPDEVIVFLAAYKNSLVFGSTPDEYFQKISDSVDQNTRTNIAVDGLTGIRVFVKGVEPFSDTVVFGKNGLLYRMELLYSKATNVDKTGNENLFNLMLSTFKFLD